MRREWTLRITGLTVSFVVALGLAEWGARRFLPDPAPITRDERNLSYRYDDELGWFPVEGGSGFLQATRRIAIRNNRYGFRDHEYGAKSKPRIAFVGDSFVWGFDVEHGERFTEYLQARVPGWEVLNHGVSGYGTDQEYLLLTRFFTRLQPDIVFLFFSINDHDDNRSNLRYGGYFKPYFLFEQDRLIKQGIPVPKSINYYALEYPSLFRSRLFRTTFELLDHTTSTAPVRNPDISLQLIQACKTFVESGGARFMLALAHHDPLFEEEITSAGIPYVNVKNDHRYREFGAHWTPQGHELVSDRILEVWDPDQSPR